MWAQVPIVSLCKCAKATMYPCPAQPTGFSFCFFQDGLPLRIESGWSTVSSPGEELYSHGDLPLSRKGKLFHLGKLRLIKWEGKGHQMRRLSQNFLHVSYPGVLGLIFVSYLQKLLRTFLTSVYPFGATYLRTLWETSCANWPAARHIARSPLAALLLGPYLAVYRHPGKPYNGAVSSVT